MLEKPVNSFSHYSNSRKDTFFFVAFNRFFYVNIQLILPMVANFNNGHLIMIINILSIYAVNVSQRSEQSSA